MERSSGSHKRSKSSVKSFMQRVSSKTDVTDGNEIQTTSSSALPSSSNLSLSTSPASTLSQQLPHAKPQSRHRSHLSTSMASLSIPDSLAPLAPSQGDVGPPSPTPKGATLEQSVRMFRVFEALRNGDTAAISKAIREQSADVGESDPEPPSSPEAKSVGRLEGTSILHLAIQCAELPVIEYVLGDFSSSSSEGLLDINIRDREGNTPLHIAAMLGRVPVVRLLLEQKDINDSIPNYQGQTPLDLARNPEIFQQLQLARSLFIDDNMKRIHSLVASCDYAELERLLTDPRVKACLDVNGGELATDPITVETGGTLLHEAARKRDVKLIQLLLLNGADPFRRDKKGKLPQDVTKDDRTRAILKRSPAAAAAQRGIQEKTILGVNAPQVGPIASEGGSGSKEGREMKGYLKKWTNYTSGYKLRWFVLEDGVLSYYKNQDDTGSACRGAINMRIAKLYMDPQDKLRFEIQGKSSVKYHLKANHQVEAKRWYWALNNAIQWSKDEAREEEKRQTRESEAFRQAKIEQMDKRSTKEGDSLSVSSSSRPTSKNLAPASVLAPTSNSHRTAASTVIDDDNGSHGLYEPAGLETRKSRNMSINGPEGDIDDDEDDDYGDDTSSHEMQPTSKDAFNITAQSAKLQLDLVAHVSSALQAERVRNPALPLSDAVATQALSSFEAAVGNLRGLVSDLLRISRDRDAYWQYRLEREGDVRRMWEESMTQVAKEQEKLETRIGESELKRRQTKRALRDALEGLSSTENARPTSQEFEEAETTHLQDTAEDASPSVAVVTRKKSTFADLAKLSDSESDNEEEFFDAIGTGEIEVVDMTVTSPNLQVSGLPPTSEDSFEKKRAEMKSGFIGYEDGPRKRLKLDADDRPKISLWAILKSMIGKDMTKMTLPVSFNEPTSLLQRVAEDMEYADLLDTAAERADSAERMVYVATFAASEYASTIGRVAKPFNPLLGETYEYARPDKGYRFFIEQVSHHPPIGAAFAESPRWDYYGESAVKSKFYGKSFDINPLGTWFLRLRPTSGGTELYTWKKVTSSVIGIITGNPTVDNYGLMEVKNWTTGEVCLLDFKARGWKASSAYLVSGKVVGADKKTRWSIGGRWNDKIYARSTPGFEDSTIQSPSNMMSSSLQASLVWECHSRPSGIPFNLTPFVVTLNALPDSLRSVIAPTDTRLRPDQRAMEDGEYDLAAVEKNRVEENQRARRRRREGNGEEFIPRWFSKEKCKTTGEEYWEFNREYWKVREAVAQGKTQWDGLEEVF